MRAIDATVNQIFAACPGLYGFSVGQLKGELCLEDVATDPWHAHSKELREELLGQIAAALLELVDEQPEAADFLCGRTFARTLH